MKVRSNGRDHIPANEKRVSVRICIGLVAILDQYFLSLGMVTSRVWIEFGLLKCDGDNKSSRKDVTMLVMCSIGALAANLVSYVNSTLWCWRSLFGITVYLVQLSMMSGFFHGVVSRHE